MSIIPWIVSTAAFAGLAIYFLIQTANEREQNTRLRRAVEIAEEQAEGVAEDARLDRLEDLNARRRLADIHVLSKALLDNLMAIEVTSRGEADHGGCPEEITYGD